MNLPDPSGLFQTIESYRYSIATGFLLLCGTATLFSFGWDALGTTWIYVSALMFFMSIGMIIVKDLIPFAKRKFEIGVEHDEEKAMKIVQMKKGSPPLQIQKEDLENFEEMRDFVNAALDSENEVSTTEDSIVITEQGIESLKNQVPSET